MEKYDVVIIGGGPAGASLGYILKSNNISCCIIEKSLFPRRKLCGGLVTNKTALLYKKIFREELSNYKMKTNNVSMYYKYKQLTTVKTEVPFYLVDRESFDYDLINKYKSIGGILFEKTTVKSVNEKESIINLSTGTAIEYKYLVGADGANSFTRKYVDKNYKPNGFCVEINEPIKSINDELQLHLGILNSGYGWIFPKNDILTVGYGGILSKNKQLTQNFDIYLENVGIKRTQRIMGAYIPYGKYVKVPYKNNIFLTGDAAGLVDPISGEGLYFAMLSAKVLADSIMEYSDINIITTNYMKEIRSMQLIIDDSRKMSNRFFKPWFLRFAATMLKKHPNVVKFACDNCFSVYNIPFKKFTSVYLEERKKRKRT